MIDLNGMISIPFLKKSRFTGSYLGMRYLLCKAEKIAEEKPAGEEKPETETVLQAVIWPEPYNFENTPEKQKHSQDFPFEKEGILEAVAWLNEEHQAGHY